MARKITDSDIVKVLDCLAGKVTNCSDCPYFRKFSRPYCKTQVAEDVIRLIKRKNSKIAKLTKELEEKHNEC